MGWGDCGNDSEGRPIGYVFEAVCDEPGCEKKINRGLSYACGGMHGEEPGCEKYFCEDHLHFVDVDSDDDYPMVCSECCELIKARDLEIADNI